MKQWQETRMPAIASFFFKLFYGQGINRSGNLLFD
jgi:hypothetical protein